MPQAISKMWVHLVFSTKGRAPFLKDLRVEKEMYAYIVGICREMESPVSEIGGVADHVHILVNLSRTVALCKLVQNIKKYSCAMVRSRWVGYERFSWQAGYGAFAVSSWNLKTIVHYIANQKAHHQVEGFEDEYRALLLQQEADFDECYVWD